MPSSAYENVVVGKLKMKGNPLDVKGSGGKKTKKKKNQQQPHFTFSQTLDIGDGIETSSSMEDRLTAAERRYLQQREKIELERLAKMATKSHRDRIEEFNQYLANLSEHHDIPKVGPG